MAKHNEILESFQNMLPNFDFKNQSHRNQVISFLNWSFSAFFIFIFLFFKASFNVVVSAVNTKHNADNEPTEANILL